MFSNNDTTMIPKQDVYQITISLIIIDIVLNGVQLSTTMN
jgi:hypothetical protein